MTRPTESAKTHFDYAVRTAKAAAVTLGKNDLISPNEMQLGNYNHVAAVAHMAKGLSDLSVGLRATYILLEEVKNLLERQRRQPT